MRRALVSGLGLLIGASVVGAIAFPEQIAQAAQIMQVRVINTAAQAVPVSQQGTVDVNVVNGSLSLVTAGGGQRGASTGTSATLSQPATASSISIKYADGGQAVILSYQGENVGNFGSPNSGPEGTADYYFAIPLTRPITFDRLDCAGVAGGICVVFWVGNGP